MHNPLAIHLQDVSKIYRLHGSQRDQLIDVLGLQRFGFKTRTATKEFAALSDISLSVPPGHRIGIVGRNGAGKTSLLKLICGNFAPTRGEVTVNGNVQALMSVGLGFHPEYSGRENVEASLQYNGLARDDYRLAMDGIIEFCELGDFLDQPFKTYSLGMQARLMFAAATAIRPDILIVDEVLGAGDAYFVAKSKRRVERLVRSGCTMLLVSHSMQQVLELCDEVIWLEKGRIRMQGEAFEVVKAYEEDLHGPIAQISIQAPIGTELGKDAGLIGAAKFRGDDTLGGTPRTYKDHATLIFQDPRFVPHAETPRLPRVVPPTSLNYIAPGGISRWESEIGLKICGFTIVTERGETNELISMRPTKFVINTVAEIDGDFPCRYGFVVFDHLGTGITKIISPVNSVKLNKGETHCVEFVLNPLQLGPGEYIISLSLHKGGSLERFNSTPRYDLLSRSFVMNIEIPESLGALETRFFHTAEWNFEGANVGVQPRLSGAVGA